MNLNNLNEFLSSINTFEFTTFTIVKIFQYVSEDHKQNKNIVLDDNWMEFRKCLEFHPSIDHLSAVTALDSLKLNLINATYCELFSTYSDNFINPEDSGLYLSIKVEPEINDKLKLTLVRQLKTTDGNKLIDPIYTVFIDLKS